MDICQKSDFLLLGLEQLPIKGRNWVENCELELACGIPQQNNDPWYAEYVTV